MIITQKVKGWDGKLLESEECEFPLKHPIFPEKIDIPRLKSWLLWGDEDHIERGSIQNFESCNPFEKF